MHIEKYVNGNKDSLRLVRTVRIKKDDGTTGNRKEIVKALGPLSRYDDGKPDYILRLRKSFQEGNPLIPELLPYIEDAPKEKWNVTYIAGDSYCISHPKRFAPCILDPVFSALGLDSLFASIKHSSRIQYDLQGIIRLLVYGRILDPASKLATMQQNDLFYIPPVKSTNDDNVYDALTILNNNFSQVIQRMNSSITKTIGRKSSVVYYDVTNFFFEIEQHDEDTTDEDGNVVKGLRVEGVSKENRKQPIVQMGLFLDDNGIPISLEIFPGNTLDHLTLRPAMQNTVDTLHLNRFILIADRGMYSGTNLCHVVDQGDGYIVSRSLKKSTAAERKWVLDSSGYTEVSRDFKYKSRIVTKTVIGEDGQKRQLQQKVVVYWSRAFYEREKHENDSFLQFIQKLKENPHGFRATAAQSHNLRKFCKKELLNKDTGEILEGDKLLALIDDDKLKEFNELMGYYQIVTSELDMPDTEVIDKYHGLTRIEDQFREMKGTLETRPIYLSTPDHIRAHLLMCFIALTMMRVIQYKLRKSMPAPDYSKDLNWSYGMSGKRVAEALLKWTVDPISAEYYRMAGIDSEDVKTILSAMGISVSSRLYTRGDLKALKSSVNVV